MNNRWLCKFGQFYGPRVSNFSPHPTFAPDTAKTKKSRDPVLEYLTKPARLILVDGITKRFNRETKFRARLGKIAGKLPADVTGEGERECYAHSRALTWHLPHSVPRSVYWIIMASARENIEFAPCIS